MTDAAQGVHSGLLDEAARAYGLPPLRLTGRVGLWGDNERLVLEAADGRSYYLKERSHLLTAAEFPGHLLVHEHALRHGAPAVALHRTLSGSLDLAWGGRQFELMTWVRGAPAQGGRTALVLLGERFGALLSALEGVRSWPAGAWDFPASRARWFPDHPSIIPGYLAYLERPASRGALPAGAARAGARVRRRVERLLADVPWSALPQQCVHGDPSPFHLLSSESGELWIDFEDARWSYRCWEVARLCAIVGGLSRDSEAEPAEVCSAWAGADIAGMLDGLSASLELSAVEREALGPLVAVALAVAAVAELDLDDPEFSTPPDLEPALAHLGQLCESAPAEAAFW